MPLVPNCLHPVFFVLGCLCIHPVHGVFTYKPAAWSASPTTALIWSRQRTHSTVNSGICCLHFVVAKQPWFYILPVTFTLNHIYINSGRPFVSRSSIMRMEQSASCCQRHAVAAVFPSAFKRHLCFDRHSTVNCQPCTFTAFQPQITM